MPYIMMRLPRAQTAARHLFINFFPRFREGRRRALYRTLGLIRTATRRSVRVRPGASRPGTPPHAHTRGGLRVIKFDADEANDSGIVGPVKFPWSRFFEEPVPHIHEFGGTFLSRRKIATYPERSYMWRTTKKLIKSGKILRTYTISLGQVL